jgi:hypothetical protein
MFLLFVVRAISLEQLGTRCNRVLPEFAILTNFLLGFWFDVGLLHYLFELVVTSS